MDKLTNWKSNILKLKWENVNHQKLEFSNSFLDKKIEILKNFFHEDDLSTTNLNTNWDYNLVDPSSIWLIYLLSQNNLGSFQLILEICDVIEYFKTKDPQYLQSKLLLKNGRINKRSFRDDFFEVWLNYRLLKKKINVDLIKCYRNPENQFNEGFDSLFTFKDNNYVIECIKLKSWHEEVLKLTFSMIKRFHLVHQKLNDKKSKAHFEDLFIYAVPTINSKNGSVEFKEHLSQYFSKKSNGENIYKSKSNSFESIHIFSNDKNLKTSLDKQLSRTSGLIIITSKFDGLYLVNSYGKKTFDVYNRDLEEKLSFKISAKTKNVRSSYEFENHLIRKVKKKVDQHKKKLKVGTKLIIAIELEQFKGINSFPINSIESFKKLKAKAKENIIIMVFYNSSQNHELKITSQTLHHKNDPFVSYINS